LLKEIYLKRKGNKLGKREKDRSLKSKIFLLGKIKAKLFILLHCSGKVSSLKSVVIYQAYISFISLI